MGVHLGDDDDERLRNALKASRYAVILVADWAGRDARVFRIAVEAGIPVFLVRMGGTVIPAEAESHPNVARVFDVDIVDGKQDEALLTEVRREIQIEMAKREVVKTMRGEG